MKKKQLKGFTLVEVLVALAVFSIMALLLSTMYVVAAKLSVDANKLNVKAERQLQYVESGTDDPNVVVVSPITETITFHFAGAGTPSSAAKNKSIAKTDIKVIEIKPVDVGGNTISDNDPPNIKYFK